MKQIRIKHSNTISYQTPKQTKAKSHTIPWLMLPQTEVDADMLKLVDMSDVNQNNFQISLPVINGSKCYFSRGWLLVVDSHFELFLVHPFTGVKNNLPIIHYFEDWQSSSMSLLNVQMKFIKKFVLFGRFSLDFTTMAVYGIDQMCPITEQVREAGALCMDAVPCAQISYAFKRNFIL